MNTPCRSTTGVHRTPVIAIIGVGGHRSRTVTAVIDAAARCGRRPTGDRAQHTSGRAPGSSRRPGRLSCWPARAAVLVTVAGLLWLLGTDSSAWAHAVLAQPVWAQPVWAQPASIDTVLTNLRNWLMGILALLATVFLTVGGVRYITAAGDPGEVEAAKRAFRSAGFGYALAALAPLLVQILRGIVGA